MKVTNMVATLAIACVCLIGSSVNGQVPQTDNGDNASLVGAKSALIKGVVGKVLTAGAVVNITTLVGPPKSADSWVAAADEVVHQWLHHGVITNSTSPTGFRRLGPRIGWLDLVYSTSTSLHNGVLNPAAPYANERGEVVWLLVEAQSMNGNDLSLDMITVAATSTGGALNDSQSFVGMTHTPRAPLVLADGSVINSGSTAQLGNRVAVLVILKLFNGGATQSGLDQVRDYVTGSSPYVMNYTAGISGHPEISVTRTLSTSATAVTPLAPMLVMGRGIIYIPNAGLGDSFNLYSRPLVDSGRWMFTGKIMGKTPIVIPMADSKRFYVVEIQQ